MNIEAILLWRRQRCVVFGEHSAGQMGYMSDRKDGHRQISMPACMHFGVDSVCACTFACMYGVCVCVCVCVCVSDIACDAGELKRTVDADGHAHVIASKKGGQAPDGPILRRNNPQLI